ncbi:MAG: 1,4-alpha-glucan branching protein GlgB [Pseudopedobacter saltans]|uniref:1,4-alpha-glucan branching enzyme GlgB n=1 Tax=Pseudopedobacter saltans TaxID=151895 RepID=A0A2W5GJ65_9SPHI|nr:MAG: 1,4-alpha-glucan branching protein GlgB [Pseudopedobacter saltans]
MSTYEQQFFVDSAQNVWNYSLFTDEEVRNFQAGTNYHIYDFFGNHSLQVLDVPGVYFSVWAPYATQVYVIGTFNNWDKKSHPLLVRKDGSGIWEGFIPHIEKGTHYKYLIENPDTQQLEKSDPVANYWEPRPSTNTITWNMDYKWKDAKWMKKRGQFNSLKSPFSLYEVHLGSWMRPDKNNETAYNTYQQMIELLVPYVKKMGFTHVELMPVTEFPFDGSWGYQGLGYFAPTSRFGNPQGFMALVDAFHQNDIGVILDWVPSHFPADEQGLYQFDGSHVYEYADSRKGFHPDWNSYIFNYGRGEVRSFLISSARFWCDVFHIDGLRVDAVSSIVKLDYSREDGEWEPNSFGGNGNIEAIQFIKDLNEMLFRDFPDIQTIAEESTDWPGVSRPLYDEGLGFGMKWMMGWMHDTLDFFKIDPIDRKYEQNKFTFSMMYFYDENFMLPLSHDEVVHGKSPMIYKMPGDEWKKFANLRLLYTYMYTHPGGKLLFMGNEFASTSEWNYKTELPWELLQYEPHQGMQNCVKELNGLLRENPAMYLEQFSPDGFEWIDLEHRDESVVVYMRKTSKSPKEDLLVILNMTPVVRWDWPISIHGKGDWVEIFNSDNTDYYGTGEIYNPEIVTQVEDKAHDQYTIEVHLPPLAGVVLRRK